MTSLPPRVLLVADDGTELSATRQTLGRAGFDVDTAQTASGAIRLLAVRRYAVIVTDPNERAQSHWETVVSDTPPQRPRWLIVVQQRELYNVLRERFASLGIVGSSTGAARSAGERLRGGHRNGGEPTGGNDTRSRGCIPPRRRISSLLTNILTRIVVASPTRAAGGGGHKAA